MITTMNLGEAIKIASEKAKRPAKNPYHREWVQRKRAEPGWWARQLQMQNQRRRDNGVP